MATDISTSAMHGRDDLLALAERRLAAVRAGHGHLLLLAGEAGIGKTRLLQAVQQLAATRASRCGARVPSRRTSSCRPACCWTWARDVPVRPCRRRRPRAGPGGRPRRVADAVADSGDAHRRRRLLVLDAAERLASLTDDGPALLALEDLHWCDELSLEIVAHLARRLRPCRCWWSARCAATSSPEPAGAVVAVPAAPPAPRRGGPALAARPRPHRAMVRELLPGQAASRRLVELVHQRSGGVPLHVEELVNAAAQGHLSADPSYVPETLAEAIQHRFRRCPRRPGHCRRRGRRPPDLRHRPADRGRRVLGAGRRRQPRRAGRPALRPRGVPGWFGFRHALIRDAIEGNAPLATAPRAARAGRGGGAHRLELGGDAYRSAHHEAAGQLAEASDAAAAAAERAAALSAHQEALDLLHRAVRCLRTGDDRRRAELLARRAAEAAATDHNAQAAEDYEPARDLLVAQRRRGGRGALLPGLVAARHLLGDPLPARIALLEQGLAEIDGGRTASGRRVGPPCWRRRPRPTWSTTGSTRPSRRASQALAIAAARTSGPG